MAARPPLRRRVHRGPACFRAFLHSLIARRLRIGAKKLLKNVARIRRDGSRMADLVRQELTFRPKESNHWALNAVRQGHLAEALLARLDKVRKCYLMHSNLCVF